MASRCRSTAAPCQICSHWLRCATRAEARAMLLTERLGLQDRSACLLLALLQQPLRLSTRASALAIAQGTTSILTAQIERCRAEQNPRALPQAGPIAGAKGERVAACGAWRQDHRLVLLCDCGGCAAGCVLPNACRRRLARRCAAAQRRLCVRSRLGAGARAGRARPVSQQCPGAVQRFSASSAPWRSRQIFR